MHENDQFELRSEEVQEILGTPPGWLIRWGTTLAFATVVILAWASYWVRYPEVVSESIRIASAEPPKRLVVANPTYIANILVENEDTVEANQVLMVFRNDANFHDVLTLETRLLQVRLLNDSTLLDFTPGRDLLLGELQEAYYDFLRRQDELRVILSAKYEKLSVQQLNRELSRARGEINIFEARMRKLAGQLDITYQRLRMEEAGLKDGTVTFQALRKTREEIEDMNREMQVIETSMREKRADVENIRSLISGARRDSRDLRSLASTDLKESFVQLKNRVEEWKKRYLLVSPIDGVAIFSSNNVAEQQYVPSQTELVVVLPLEKTETIGKIDLNINGWGKVVEGQKVIVKLESYPFHEFGALVGVVARKGRLPSGSTIPIEVHFPNGLVTTTGKAIDPTREMTGNADIITEDKRFIERIFEQFRRLNT
jgi:multidrug efflux pump subunit AcrA (membrane-fusion protein)